MHSVCVCWGGGGGGALNMKNSRVSFRMQAVCHRIGGFDQQGFGIVCFSPLGWR